MMDAVVEGCKHSFDAIYDKAGLSYRRSLSFCVQRQTVRERVPLIAARVIE